ncbi:phosphatase 2C-like domain-containing protein [Cokeromyces recurvatus]|uniref:phosphatase 2C-like domain-containing protein n=1 Tax=Cokeromyces recurvatus TaxID=90255 RepID=UPI00221FFCF0|nr:phosphatase 2C-like domain-containing protein [Cokeromyces recurvatus]KAI7906951.1 phosphatase 2C-like domain-containing protein [Cokeromyces recurvatus]
MGQILASPITTKHTTEGKNSRLLFGASSMQGWRISMEDAHTHILDYENTGTAFFAVFDGHGGANIAKYSSQQLPELVINSEDFKKGEYKDSLRKGFFQIDANLREDPEYEHEPSGCTAIVALLTKDNVLYISNAGDSRAIICANGIAVALSQDHKPTNPKETERIKNAGGYVEMGRVNGNLALSRALGDFEFKNATDLPPEKQAVTADPDITVHKMTDKDEFIVLACDGIWDCMTNQEVATFVRKHVANNVPLKEICERLMDNCLADSSNTGGVGCDNMTVEIIAFLNGKTEEEWYAKIRDSVAELYPTEVVNSINAKQVEDSSSSSSKEDIEKKEEEEKTRK